MLMHPTDVDVLLSGHARQIERVNRTAWARTAGAGAQRGAARRRVGLALVSLGERLASDAAVAARPCPSCGA